MMKYIDNIKYELFITLKSKLTIGIAIVFVIFSAMYINADLQSYNLTYSRYLDEYQRILEIENRPEDIIEYDFDTREDYTLSYSGAYENKLSIYNIDAVRSLQRLEPTVFVINMFSDYIGIVFALLTAVVVAYMFLRDYTFKIYRIRCIDNDDNHIMISKVVSAIIITLVSFLIFIACSYLVALFSYNSVDISHLVVEDFLYYNYNINLFDFILNNLIHIYAFASVMIFIGVIVKNSLLPSVIMLLYVLLPSVIEYDLQGLLNNITNRFRMNSDLLPYYQSSSISLMSAIIYLIGFSLVLNGTTGYIFKKQSKY